MYKSEDGVHNPWTVRDGCWWIALYSSWIVFATAWQVLEVEGVGSASKEESDLTRSDQRALDGSRLELHALVI